MYICPIMIAADITNRIREIMKARRITQNELAARLNVSQNQISQYLAGSPRLDTLLSIAAALDLDPADLFRDDAPGQQTAGICPHCGQPVKIYLK